MANPYHKLFNLLAFVLLAGALYINFVKPDDVKENHPKSMASKKTVSPPSRDNKVYIARTEEQK